MSGTQVSLLVLRGEHGNRIPMGYIELYFLIPYKEPVSRGRDEDRRRSRT